MKRVFLFVILISFICVGFQAAFGQEQKDQKGEYQKRMEAKLQDVKQKIEELKIKGRDLNQDAKAKFNEQMRSLKRQENAADKKLKQLKSEGAKNWEKTKAEMDNIMNKLDQQYDKMVSKFK